MENVFKPGELVNSSELGELIIIGSDKDDYTIALNKHYGIERFWVGDYPCESTGIILQLSDFVNWMTKKNLSEEV